MNATPAAAHAPRHTPAGTHHTRAVPAHARQLAAQLSALFDRDVEIAKRLNDAHHHLRQAGERLSSGLAPDAFGLTDNDAGDGRDRPKPDRQTAPRRRAHGHQPGARGSQAVTLADPPQLLPVPGSVRGASAARVRHRRALPTAHPAALRRRLERGPSTERQRPPPRRHNDPKRPFRVGNPVIATGDFS